MSIRILLADDHQVVREGFRALLEKEPSMEVVAEAGDGRTAIRLARELLPDVVVMDINMPDLNGIESTRQIAREIPQVKVVALSIHSDRRFVVEMLRAGARGYLLKECAFDELARAIRAVTAGETYLSARITQVVVDEYVKRPLKSDETSAAAVLTNREREVLQLLAEGGSTKQIALRLHLSVKTIEACRRQIMNKLDLHSIAELTKYAIREGLTSLEP